MLYGIDVIEDEGMFLDYIVQTVERGMRANGYMIEDVNGYTSLEEYKRARNDWEAQDEGCPRIVVLDLNLQGGLSGFAAIRKRDCCLSPEDKVWVFSREVDLPMIAAMLESQMIEGYLTKRSGKIEELVDAIEATFRGETYETEIMEKARRCGERYAPDLLTEREVEAAVQLYIARRTPKQAAGELGLEPSTIYTLRRRIEQKMGTGSDVEIHGILTKAGFHL
ncbi:response regulator transcription factor [Thioalkalivibrio sp. ALE16]|uniref:response regulator transcription factor n=1 Tax=Thioalkalivibrio sp. ALE16 TaxID=1158172 RepID=UPI0003650064|nr:response regulator transcription factor [Thioalkalivibrio sp. ALE16]